MSLVKFLERRLPEQLRDRRIAEALREIRKRVRNPNLRADILWRINRLVTSDPVDLDSRARRAAFADVFQVFTWRDFHLRVRRAAVADDHGGVIAFFGHMRFRGWRAAKIARTVAVGGQVARHDYLEVAPRFRSRGLAMGILKASFDYYDTIGILVVVVHAALETGRHYWARCGFDFLDAGERKKVDDWFQLVLTALGLTFNTAALTHANDYTTISGLLPKTTVSFNEICTATGLPSAQVAEVARKNGLTMTEQIDLAKAIMLTGPDWWGRLRLDPTSHDRRVFENFFQIRAQSLVP